MLSTVPNTRWEAAPASTSNVLGLKLEGSIFYGQEASKTPNFTVYSTTALAFHHDDGDDMVVLYRGRSNEVDTSLIYAPYILYMPRLGVDPATFEPAVSGMTRSDINTAGNCVDYINRVRIKVTNPDSEQ
jgi:hypothetical protein